MVNMSLCHYKPCLQDTRAVFQCVQHARPRYLAKTGNLVCRSTILLHFREEADGATRIYVRHAACAANHSCFFVQKSSVLHSQVSHVRLTNSTGLITKLHRICACDWHVLNRAVTLSFFYVQHVQTGQKQIMIGTVLYLSSHPYPNLLGMQMQANSSKQTITSSNTPLS